MKTTTISNLKDRLSSYVESVRSGESVLVTDRRVPVALLQPIDSARLPAELQPLLAEGIVRPGSRAIRVDEFLALPKARLDGGLTRTLFEDREEA